MHSSGNMYDPVRCKPVAAKPEERVRQALVAWLMGSIKVPSRLIAVEYSLAQLDPTSRDRADVVVWRPAGKEGGLKPWLLAECKAPGIGLDDVVADQLRRYAGRIRADFIVATNGEASRYFRLDESGYREAPSLPVFSL